MLPLQASARYTSSKRLFNGFFGDGGDGNFVTAFGVLSNAVHNGMFAPPTPANPSYVPPGGCVTFDTNNLPVQNVHKEAPEHNISWRGGVSWKASEDMLLYANVTQGHKSGNFGTLPLVTTTQQGQVSPEDLTAYEVASKASALDRRIAFSGALFYYNYKNTQFLGTNNTPIFFV